MSSSSPLKKKMNIEKKANNTPVNTPTICNYKFNKKCEQPAAPEGRDPTKCAAHQLCTECHKTCVGKKPARQREGICPKCVTEATKSKKTEDMKEHVRNLKVPEEERLLYRAVKEAMNETNVRNAVKTPSQGTVAENTTEDAYQHLMLKNMMGESERFFIASSKKKDKNKGTRWIDLTDCNLFITDGNKEDAPGTERKVIRNNVTEVDGNNLLEVDGIEGTLHSGQYVVLRDKNGKEAEKQYNVKMGRMKKNLIFVDSFDDVDFAEGKSKVYLRCSGVPYYEMKGGKVKEVSRSNSNKKFTLGVFPKSKAEDAKVEAKNWLQSDDFHDWAKTYAMDHPGITVDMDVIHEEMERRQLKIPGGKVSMPTMKEDEDLSRLLQNHPNPVAGGTNNHDSDELWFLLDDADTVNMDIDSIGRLPPNKRPQLKHVTNHAIRGNHTTRFPSDDDETHHNENYRFDKQAFLTTLNQIRQIRTGQLNYTHLVSNFGPHLQAMSYGDGATSQSAFEGYLDDCHGKLCLLGPVYLRGKALNPDDPDNAPGSPLTYAPHVTPAKSISPRVYVSASLPNALRRHRTKQGWEYYYGWGRQYGKRCTVCIIDPKFWPLIGRVGCSNAHGDQNDLGSTLLPLQIRTIYEVTWNSPHLHDSGWRKIFENGNWIPYAQTHVSGFIAANAAH